MVVQEDVAVKSTKKRKCGQFFIASPTLKGCLFAVSRLKSNRKLVRVSLYAKLSYLDLIALRSPPGAASAGASHTPLRIAPWRKASDIRSRDSTVE